MKKILAAVLVWGVFAGSGYAQWTGDVETGVAFSGYNVARIPGDGGSYVSLSDDFSLGPAAMYRLRAAYAFSDRDELSALAAPLTLRGSGTLSGPVSFAGKSLPGGVPATASYRFDSYRLSYLRTIRREGPWIVKIGFTAKIRDAAIGIEAGGIFAEKKNTGLVPLLGFSGEYLLGKGFSVLVAGDALAAPQGRAEDVLFAAAYRQTEALRWRLGYRVLEGGADNDDVFNFALVNFVTAGLTYSW